MPTNDDIVQEEILRAALQLYRKYGPGKVTMDDLATATGRSRSSLYYYYKNRDEIFQAVLDTIVSDVAQAIRKAVAATNGLNDQLYTFCIAKLKTSEEWKTVLKSMWLAMSEDERTKHSAMMGSLHKKLLYQEGVIVNEILSAAIDKKEIRNISAGERDMLAFIISSSIRGIRSEVFEQNDPHDAKKAMKMLTAMIESWLK